MTTETARALAEADKRLRASAAVHKRSAGAHRRALRDTMEALNQVRRVAEAHGIDLAAMTVETETEIQEGQSGRRDDSTS